MVKVWIFLDNRKKLHPDIFIVLVRPGLHTYHVHFDQDIAFEIRVIFSAGLWISWISYRQPGPFDIMMFWAWYERLVCVLCIEEHSAVHGVFTLGSVTTGWLYKVFKLLLVVLLPACRQQMNCRGSLCRIDYIRQHQTDLSGGRSRSHYWYIIKILDIMCKKKTS